GQGVQVRPRSVRARKRLEQQQEQQQQQQQQQQEEREQQPTQPQLQDKQQALANHAALPAYDPVTQPNSVSIRIQPHIATDLKPPQTTKPATRLPHNKPAGQQGPSTPTPITADPPAASQQLAAAGNAPAHPLSAAGQGPAMPAVAQAVTVTLHDCLACSGCITSAGEVLSRGLAPLTVTVGALWPQSAAETVLLSHQSSMELEAKMQEPGTTVVITISAQSRSALAAFYGLSPGETQQRLAAWLASRGVASVLDLGTARDMALVETAAEFIARWGRAAWWVVGTAWCDVGDEGPEEPVAADNKVSLLMPGYTWRHPHPAAAAAAAATATATAAAAAILSARFRASRRHQQQHQQQRPKQPACPPTTQPLTQQQQQQVQPESRQGAEGQEGEACGTPDAPGPLPMLASACPGWVCYAEKTQSESLLPFIASTKSPQAVMGSLVKRVLAPRLGVIDPAKLYHCTVMPCYDKKLEASRTELTLEGTQVPEVDCCLTSGELQQLLAKHGVQHLRDVALPAGPLPSLFATPSLGPDAHHDTVSSNSLSHSLSHSFSHSAKAQGQPSGQDFVLMDLELPKPQQQLSLCDNGNTDHTIAQVTPAPSHFQPHSSTPVEATPGTYPLLYGLPGASGGYADFVFRTAAEQLFGRHLPPGPLPYQTLRNADFQGLNCRSEIRMGRCEYDYIEACHGLAWPMAGVTMACPSGCLNGGGQIKPLPGQSPQQLLDELDGMYHHADVVNRHPLDNPELKHLYHGWVEGTPASENARRLLHTTYRKRGGQNLGAVAGDW
ncbi:hypothetical protein QJQ45_022344, partial [Haematococcus lacustris]